MADYATKDDVRGIVKEAVDDLSEVISTFAQHVDTRFSVVENRFDTFESRFDEFENRFTKLQADVNSILNHLDSIEKDLSINDDERAVMGMQLTRLHDWVEKAAQKIGVEFIH